MRFEMKYGSKTIKQVICPKCGKSWCVSIKGGGLKVGATKRHEEACTGALNLNKKELSVIFHATKGGDHDLSEQLKNEILNKRISQIEDIYAEAVSKFGGTLEKLAEYEKNENLLRVNEKGGNSIFYLQSPLLIGKIGEYDAYCVGYEKNSEGGICLSIVYDQKEADGVKYFDQFGYITDTNIMNNDYVTRKEVGGVKTPVPMNLNIVPDYKEQIYALVNSREAINAMQDYVELRDKAKEILYRCQVQSKMSLDEIKTFFKEKFVTAGFHQSSSLPYATKDWNKIKDMNEAEFEVYKASLAKSNKIALDILNEILEEEKGK